MSASTPENPACARLSEGDQADGGSMTNGASAYSSVRVISLDVDVLDLETAANEVIKLSKEGNGGYASFINAHSTIEAHLHKSHAIAVRGSTLVLPDGAPVVWMQKLLGERSAGRVRANDLMIRLCEIAAERGIPVGFYGSSPAVIDAIRNRAARELPGLKIHYAYSPPYRPLGTEEHEQVLAEILASGPQLLFVGLGCPKQERWMHENRGSLDTFMLGVGVSLDYYAGEVAEAPPGFRSLGLEWFYRLLHEPGRLWRRYLLLNPYFIFLSLLQLLGLERKPNSWRRSG
ncbi:MAG: WecB/TagA/CpsF family glycosyltransferase [Aridibacter famidurans]|nr:WecB/TagA/CpsF family glycosyltransferase [Aridibacter famidurans]